MADALKDLLDKSPLSAAQRAGLWDVYTASRNEDDLKARLDSMDLPKSVKADLWDLKLASAQQQDTQTTAPSSQGTWIDKGLAGMMWKPASGVSERNRADVQVLGVPPELAAIGGAQVGRAVVGAGAGLAARAAAGAKAAAGTAMPVLKYEVVKSGLEYAGLPAPVATVAAMLFSGYKKGATPATAAETVAPATTETAATTLQDVQKTVPAAGGLTPLEMTRKVRDEFRAMLNEQAKMAASKPKLSGDEVLLGRKLLESGLSGEDALTALLERRKFIGVPKATDIGNAPQSVLDLLKTESFRKLPQP